MPISRMRRRTGEGVVIATVEGPLRITVGDLNPHYNTLVLDITRAGQTERRDHFVREPLIFAYPAGTVRIALSEWSRPHQVELVIEVPQYWLVTKAEHMHMPHRSRR
jgi:hypothetical protein